MNARAPSPSPIDDQPASLSKEATPESVYLGRQPIVDRNGALNAFELLFRSDATNLARVTDDADATAQVLARLVGDMGLSAALGDHTGYLNVDRTVLMSDMVRQLPLPPERFVLEILETVTFDEALFRRCNELRRAGFRLALDDVSQVSPRLLAFLPCVDIVKIDFMECPRERLAELVAAVRQHRKVSLAEKVETRGDHDAAMRAGFELFQGYHFAKPQVLTSRRITPSRDALLRLMVLLSGEPGILELEAELKRIPNLVVQLLRLLQSSASGLARTISSMREAIMVVGTRQITRWAQLLLFADGNLDALRSDPLSQLCGTRARFMELASGRLRPDDVWFADTAFMTGVFSLIHVLFGSAIEDILSTMPIHADMRRALLERQGDLGLLLNAAEAAESGELTAIRTACNALPVFTPNDLIVLGLTAVG
ncbi:Cyclic di-GMP phosphodiesterase CdgJ [Paraburkholderia ultramafica]|uniref:Cyclic di-GMP phosphodiesterase CdgJ n=1 Tax=Paraburkholderia ultramafica TaxID=1544867 RepID=A0A6S7CRL8_9BURK|nr:EAL domain-containing protein [Paraburkholderia ultramafica]CAB3786170.1 Cyclic di-GMP phosphodiesterase CdgJ [Paraburkholderia ultramafica]